MASINTAFHKSEGCWTVFNRCARKHISLVYATGSIHLKSNVTLAVDAGAVLKFFHPNTDTSLLVGEALENVKIYGPGTLDGMGSVCITLQHCNDVEIRNLNVYRGGDPAILVEGCDELLVDNTDIRTGSNGLNLSVCHNVTVTDCHIDTVRREYGRPVGGGEAIKVNGEELSSENITVQDCFLMYK